MTDILTRCDELITDMEFTRLKRWKEEHPGGKAIAYFPVYAPVEIIHACGMLPVGLHGGGDQLDIQYADARFGSFICSIAKTTLELGLTDRLANFDGLIVGSICDTARNLCFVAKRNFPHMWIDFVHFPHNPTSEASIEFLTAEYRRILGELEQMAGVKVSDADLRESIALFNANRDLTRRLIELRSESPQLLSTHETYSVIRAGDYLPVDEHTRLLAELLDTAHQRTAKMRDSIRVVIEGSFCEQPPLDLIRLVEAAGCYVVDDDFALGRRWFTADVPATRDPIESLARSYVNESVYSSVRHDFRKPRFKGLIEKVRTQRADAVILLIAKFCEPAYFDYVLFKRELEKEGVPHILIEFEEKMYTFDRIQTEIETFVESLLFA